MNISIVKLETREVIDAKGRVGTRVTFSVLWIPLFSKTVWR